MDIIQVAEFLLVSLFSLEVCSADYLCDPLASEILRKLSAGPERRKGLAHGKI
jgi:hypothetical protein